MPQRPRGVAAAALVAIVLAAGCQAGDTTPQTAPTSGTLDPIASAPRTTPGTLRIGLSADPTSLDPAHGVGQETELVVGALFRPLVRLDRSLSLQPGAAARWEQPPDLRSVTFSMRPDGRFHDGTPVTAHDARRALDRIADGTGTRRSPAAPALRAVVGFPTTWRTGAPLRGVEVVDDLTLRVRLRWPDAEFVAGLARPAFAPVPAAASSDPGFADAPVGNGPFEIVPGSWERGEFVRLTRAEGSVETSAGVDELLFQIYAGDGRHDAQWSEFEAGRLHVASVPVDRLDEAALLTGSSADGYSGPGLLDGVTSTVYFFGFDVTRPPFDHPDLRRALSLLVDRRRIVDEITSGARAVADSIIPPPLPAYQPSACVWCRFDPVAAAELVDAARRGAGAPEPSPAPVAGTPSASAPTVGPDPTEAGGQEPAPASGSRPTPAPDPTRPADPEPTRPAGPGRSGADPSPPGGWPGAITIVHNEGATHDAIARRVAADVEAALGIRVDTRSLPLGVMLDELRAGEIGMFRLGWTAASVDAGSLLFPLFHSSRRGIENLTRYHDPEVDRLLEQARAEPDATVRRNHYREVERTVLSEAAVVPVFHYRHERVVSEDVRGFRLDPFGRADLATVTLVEAD